MVLCRLVSQNTLGGGTSEYQISGGGTSEYQPNQSAESSNVASSGSTGSRVTIDPVETEYSYTPEPQPGTQNNPKKKSTWGSMFRKSKHTLGLTDPLGPGTQDSGHSYNDASSAPQVL